MAGLLPRRAVRCEVPGHLGDVEATQSGDHRKAHTAYERKGILGGSSDPDRRMRFLIGPGDHGQIIAAKIGPAMREALVVPGFENDLEGFLETRPTLIIGDAVAGIGSGEATAPDTEVKAPAANLIHGGGLFGEANRMTQRQDTDPGADAQAGGAGSNGAGQNERDRSNRRNACPHGISWSPGAGEVSLGQPDPIEPIVLRYLRNGERLCESFFLGPPLSIVTFHHQTGIHSLLLSCSFTTGSAQRFSCSQ